MDVQFDVYITLDLMSESVKPSSALSLARERRQAIEAFRDCMPWFDRQCSYGGKYATKGYDLNKAFESVLFYFNEMRSHIKRDHAVCDHLLTLLHEAHAAFEQGEEEKAKQICDQVWRMPELKKLC